MNTGCLKLPVVVLACFLTVSSLAGCATGDRKINLSYARPELYLTRHSGDIVLLRPVAPASDRNLSGDWIIGSLNNVHGVHQANLLSDRSTAEWVTDALLYELRQAGYQVSYQESLPVSASRGIAVKSIRTAVSIDQGTVSADAHHEIGFNVEIFLNGDHARTLTVTSRDDRTVPFTISAKELEAILQQSLQDAMKRLMPDIIVLIDPK